MRLQNKTLSLVVILIVLFGIQVFTLIRVGQLGLVATRTASSFDLAQSAAENSTGFLQPVTDFGTNTQNLLTANLRMPLGEAAENILYRTEILQNSAGYTVKIATADTISQGVPTDCRYVAELTTDRSRHADLTPAAELAVNDRTLYVFENVNHSCGAAVDKNRLAQLMNDIKSAQAL